MTGPYIVGVDSSLTALGLAAGAGTRTIATKTTGAARLDYVSHELVEAIRAIRLPDLVAIEGYSYGSPQGGERLGELGGCIRRDLYRAGIPYVEVAPNTVKLYATGGGNAKKGAVLEAALKRFPSMEFDGDDNRADAWWLRAMTLDWYGFPPVDMPAVNRSALSRVTKKTNKRTGKTTVTPVVAWPTLPAFPSPAWNPDAGKWGSAA